HQTSDIQRTERMLVKESLDLADDGSRLSVARATLGQCRVANVFGSNQGQDEQGEQFHLILAVLGEVGNEAQTERFQGNGRRALFSRIGRRISSPLEKCRVLRCQSQMPGKIHSFHSVKSGELF
uniref:hypothetical protein n=1 Tax=Deinococcus frigens TaxID=249403 RepID=UPI0004952038